MGTGLIIFIVLARTLGPRDYGFLSTVIAYASLAGLLTDFGFTLKTLRDIAANPDQGGQILQATFRVKAMLTTLVLTVGCVILALLRLGAVTKVSGALIFSGFLAASIGDLGLVAFRAVGKYSRETRIVAWTWGLYGASVCTVALLHLGIVSVAATILASRLLYAFVAIASVRKLFPNVSEVRFNIATVLIQIRRSLSWAMDAGLGFISAQIDSLVVVQVLGLASAGIYTSGSRFAQAALALVSVLSYVHIPAVAATSRTLSFSGREKRMLGEFAGLGGACAVFFLAFGPLLTSGLLGRGYAGVDPLWPGFAAFVFARYVAAALGVALTAHSRPRLRVAGQAVGLTVIAVGFWLALPQAGLIAAPWIMAAGALATLLIYAYGRFSMTTGAQAAW
jgi:O-antigen/teichoic acid export membrane protein